MSLSAPAVAFSYTPAPNLAAIGGGIGQQQQNSYPQYEPPSATPFSAQDYYAYTQRTDSGHDYYGAQYTPVEPSQLYQQMTPHLSSSKTKKINNKQKSGLKKSVVDHIYSQQHMLPSSGEKVVSMTNPVSSQPSTTSPEDYEYYYYDQEDKDATSNSQPSLTDPVEEMFRDYYGEGYMKYFKEHQAREKAKLAAQQHQKKINSNSSNKKRPIPVRRSGGGPKTPKNMRGSPSNYQAAVKKSKRPVYHQQDYSNYDDDDYSEVPSRTPLDNKIRSIKRNGAIFR